MNDSTLKKGIQALQWESYYRKNGTDQRSNHFLAPTGNLDVDFETNLNRLDICYGKALDIGAGTGEQAIFLAKKGFDVTATEVSKMAIENARKLAAGHNLPITFMEDNILATGLNDQFDLIIDRGCFTILPAVYKEDYLLAIKKLLKVNGWLFLKADKKKGNDLSIFSDDMEFKVYSLEASNYASLNNKLIPAVVLVTQKVG